MKISGANPDASETTLQLAAQRRIETQEHRTAQRREDETARTQDQARDVRAQEERAAVGRNLDAKA